MKLTINSDRWTDLKNLPGEVWRTVEDTPENGTYLVSNYGRVKRLPFYGGRYHQPEQILRIHRNRDGGYYKVRIGTRMYYVHRLVAMAFIRPHKGDRLVDHKNGDIADNRARNLRWVTAYENSNNPITKWKRGGCLGEKPSIPRTQINLKNYDPEICVSKHIFITERKPI